MRENIEVEIADRVTGHGEDGTPIVDGKTAVILDRKANRAWSGEGKTENQATTEATRKFIGDRRAREYIG